MRTFDRAQAVRQKNFIYLRNLMGNVRCLVPLTLYDGVRTHGMYMFAMRYKQQHCGGLSLEHFLKLVQAEGAPIYRAFAATMSDQPAIKKILWKNALNIFRRLPTPIADQAATDTVYIAQNVFLGTTQDMEDIVGSIKKVETHRSK